MAVTRCARCGGSNVDHEGYCWDCEHQQRFAAPAAPRGVAASGGAVPGGAAGGSRPSRLSRVLTMVVAPIVTIVLIGCGFAAVLVFERADAVVRSYPTGTASATVDPASAAACVVGVWRLAASEEDLELQAGRTVRATGAGGTLTLGADGTGSLDHAGWQASTIMNGATATVTATGVERFRYRVGGGLIGFGQVAGAVEGVAEAHGQRVWAGALRPWPTASPSRLGCGGSVLTLALPATASGSAGTAKETRTYTRTP